MNRDKPDYLLKIKAKRFYRESEKGYSFLTSGYGGRFFFIPKSQIIYKDVDEDYWRIKVNSFIFSKIKGDLGRMRPGEVRVDEIHKNPSKNRYTC